MLTKIERLESQLAEVQAKISPTAFEQWLSSNSTKALKLQMEIDQENITDNWKSGRYIGEEEPKARGTAEYIDGLFAVLPLLRGEDNDD